MNNMKKLNLFLFALLAIAFIACGDDEKKKGEDPGTEPKVVLYSVGDYYNVNGVKGVVYKVTKNGEKGMIVSLDQKKDVWANSANQSVKTSAFNEDNGMKNMDSIKKNFKIADFPAFKWCDDKNGQGVKGWYLPSKNELNDIYKVYNILQKTLASKGTPFDTLGPTGNYRTSTENEANPSEAWTLRFSNGNLAPGNKFIEQWVRAVKSF